MLIGFVQSYSHQHYCIFVSEVMATRSTNVLKSELLMLFTSLLFIVALSENCHPVVCLVEFIDNERY